MQMTDEEYEVEFRKKIGKESLVGRILHPTLPTDRTVPCAACGEPSVVCFATIDRQLHASTCQIETGRGLCRNCADRFRAVLVEACSDKHAPLGDHAAVDFNCESCGNVPVVGFWIGGGEISASTHPVECQTILCQDCVNYLCGILKGD